ncbi:Fic family protein [bacterium]|nr:Fic family protein [bacterium]
MTDFKWSFITDLPENWRDFASIEMQILRDVWVNHIDELKKRDSLEDFHEKLAREWAIETGIIERIYDIKEGTTQLLIEKGLEASYIAHGSADKPAEEIIEILKDHKEVLEGLFDFVKGRRKLTISYIKEIHQQLTRHQKTVQAQDQFGKRVQVPLLRGEWKKLPNNPLRENGSTHEYCPTEHVQTEMENLVRMHKEHELQEIPPEIEAAWLHHRFTQIHPFQDGNGRVVRALASLVFIRENCFPLVIHRDKRQDYIEYLEKADRGDLRYLIKLFSAIQINAFKSALGHSDEILMEAQEELLQTAIKDGAERLRRRRQQSQEELRGVFDISIRLESIAFNKLEAAELQLKGELHNLDSEYSASVQRSDNKTTFWFGRDVITIAKELGYFADTRTYHAWVRLRISEIRQANLVISFHCLGTKFYGIMVVSAFMTFRDRDAMESDGHMESIPEGPYKLSDEVFLFSHKEKAEQVDSRFNNWLDHVLLIGIEQWKKQI